MAAIFLIFLRALFTPLLSGEWGANSPNPKVDYRSTKTWAQRMLSAYDGTLWIPFVRTSADVK